ncbi:MAG: sigma-70 family RNA polymerase sigma factor [Anaerolineae bacterium]
MDSVHARSAHTHSDLELITLAQGPEPAASQAFEALRGRYGFASHPRVPRSLMDDAKQAAALGLFDALLRFDPDRRAQLGTYARNYVRKAVNKTWEDAPSSRNGYDLIYLDDAFSPAGDSEAGLGDTDALHWDEREPDPEAEGIVTQLERCQRSAAVRNFVASLTPQQAYIVKRVYYDERSIAEVARELGISRQAAHKMLNHTLTKGRKVLAEFEAASQVA